MPDRIRVDEAGTIPQHRQTGHPADAWGTRTDAANGKTVFSSAHDFRHNGTSEMQTANNTDGEQALSLKLPKSKQYQI